MKEDYKLELDSILQIEEVEAKINALNLLAYNTRYINPAITLEAASKALKLSKKNKNEVGENTAKMHLAFSNFILSNDYPILQQLTEAHQFFHKTLSIPEYPILLNYMGNVYESFGEYQKGLSLCHEALSYVREYYLKEVEGDILSTIGIVMSRISDYEGSVENFKKSYAIRKELNNEPAMASSLNLLARTYALNNLYNLSEDYYQQAIKLRLEINETGALPWSYIGLASLYEKKNDFENAKLYYNKSLEYNLNFPDKRCSLHCFLGLSRIFLETNNLEEAKINIDKILQVAQELNANPILYEGYKILSDYYEKLGMTKEAFDSFKKFHKIRESVLNAQTHSMLKNQQASFEVEKIQKDAEIHHLRNIELKNAYDALEQRTKEILDSIDYAKKIQNALLPPIEYLQSLFPESFICNHPKDIVGGDFYWCFSNGNKRYVCVADCTGHGVPGGFMSILGISMLNEIVNSFKDVSVDELLNELRRRVIASLRQSMMVSTVKDGMDIAICCIDKEHNQIEYAGAYNPLYIVKNNILTEIKALRMPIGIDYNFEEPFTKNIIPIEKGMAIYMSSDGFEDQFGGPEGKKFKSKNYKELILKYANEPMNRQLEKFDGFLTDWMKGYEQIDDILLMGIRLD
jgi:serine phosphatase RsbU (regulator of sigma subunit)